MYGRTGVCTIEEIGPIHNQKQDKQSYYKLRAMSLSPITGCP